MTTDLNTLLTALYVKIDDEIGGTRCLGRPPLLSDSELVCLAVAQALLGYHSEARWLRYANKHLTGMFPYLPQRPGYHKRLKAALPLLKRMIRDPRFGDERLEELLLTIFTRPQPLARASRQAGDPIRVRPVLFHLLWRGRLSADLGHPLGETTVVTALSLIHI